MQSHAMDRAVCVKRHVIGLRLAGTAWAPSAASRHQRQYPRPAPPPGDGATARASACKHACDGRAGPHRQAAAACSSHSEGTNQRQCCMYFDASGICHLHVDARNVKCSRYQSTRVVLRQRVPTGGAACSCSCARKWPCPLPVNGCYKATAASHPPAHWRRHSAAGGLARHEQCIVPSRAFGPAHQYSWLHASWRWVVGGLCWRHACTAQHLGAAFHVHWCQ